MGISRFAQQQCELSDPIGLIEGRRGVGAISQTPRLCRVTEVSERPRRAPLPVQLRLRSFSLD